MGRGGLTCRLSGTPRRGTGDGKVSRSNTVTRANAELSARGQQPGDAPADDDRVSRADRRPCAQSTSKAYLSLIETWHAKVNGLIGDQRTMFTGEIVGPMRTACLLTGDPDSSGEGAIGRSADIDPPLIPAA